MRRSRSRLMDHKVHSTRARANQGVPVQHELRRSGRWSAKLAVVLMITSYTTSGRAEEPETVSNEVEALAAEYEHLLEEGRYGEAEVIAERACALLSNAQGSNSAELAQCLNDLAFISNAQRKHQRAKQLYMRAIAIWRRAESIRHPFFVQLLVNLGCVYHDQRRHSKAEYFYKQALSIAESNLGPDPSPLLLGLNNLAMLYYDQAAYERARPLYERALSIAEDTYGSDDPRITMFVNNLAGLHDDSGEDDRAIDLYKRALAIRESSLGPDDLDAALIRNNLAGLFWEKGDYERALTLYERTLAVRESALSPDHLEIARSLDHLAGLYGDFGHLAKAKPLYERALAIREKALGAEDLTVANTLHGLGALYYDQGIFEKAEPLYRRSLAIREKVLGRDHPLVGRSLNNLANLYYAEGSYGVAESLHRRALAIFEKGSTSDRHMVATSLASLAALQREQGAYEEAEALCKRAILLLRESLGPTHPRVAISVSNLALFYHEQGRLEEAEPLYEEALIVLKKTNHPSLSITLHNLAMLRQDQGAYEEARALYEQALANLGESAGSNWGGLILEKLASLYDEVGEPRTAADFLRQALDIEESNLSRTLMIANEERRLAYAATLSDSLDYVLSLHLRATPNYGVTAQLALTTLLRRKNRVQDLVTQSNTALRRSLPASSRRVLSVLSVVESQISVLSHREPDATTVEAHERRIAGLSRKRDELWIKLAEHDPAIGTLGRSITIEEIQRTLPEGGVLLELVRYASRHDDFGHKLSRRSKALPRYAAYILFPNRFDWVDLGPTAPIDEHVKAFRNALQTKQPIPNDLYDAVMRPIVEKLGSARRLIIAPAGDLSLIPFGALHDGEQYLIEKYDLRYVTTSRDLLPTPATPSVTTTPISIVANPIGANLPDAALEADFLASLFPKTRVLQGDQATETNVRTIERPLVLHVATHGFFGDALNERDNPLFRSGLYLADIDQVEVDRERDDGQLTAYEVTGMDLRGTQLVVLSACETGLGAAVRAEGKELMSEGIAGLRRAFAMAGARTMAMSLWEVSGVTTQKTMEAYYRKLAEGMGRGEAMQAVQLEMLRTQEHAHPKDWAAFIVSGDDTPMVFPEGEEPRVEDEEPQGPPPVRRRAGCAVAAPASDHDPPVSAFLLGLLGLGILRRRRS